jgi:hypothetical protein
MFKRCSTLAACCATCVLRAETVFWSSFGILCSCTALVSLDCMSCLHCEEHNWHGLWPGSWNIVQQTQDFTHSSQAWHCAGQASRCIHANTIVTHESRGTWLHMRRCDITQRRRATGPTPAPRAACEPCKTHMMRTSSTLLWPGSPAMTSRGRHSSSSA